MKQIAVWKVVLLTLITGGLYAIFWAGRNRDYLVKEAKVVKKLPSWVWLVFIPALFGLEVLTMIAVYVAGYSGILSADATSVWVMSATIVTLLLVLAIGVWWFWYFGKAIEEVTQGRISRTASVLLYVFAGAFVVAFQQHYVNRTKENEKGETYKTSGGLWLLVGVVAVLSILFSVASFYSLVNEMNITKADVLREQGQLQKVDQQQQNVDRLANEYTACIENLNAQYPEDFIEPESEAAYMEAYEKCDAIYMEYESAYKGLTGEELEPASPERV